MIGVGCPGRCIVLGLVAPDGPAGSRTAREEFQAVAEAAAFDQVVLLVGLAAVLALLGRDDVLLAAPGGEGADVLAADAGPYLKRYRPFPRNSRYPPSRSTCNCCLILGRTLLFLGKIAESSRSKP